MADIRVLLSVAMVILAVTDNAEAKRGCSAFGHSCYGGHGKRSGNTNAFGEPATVPLISIRELLLDGRRGAGEAGGGREREVAAPRTRVYPDPPHADGTGLDEVGDVIPIRDGGVYERGDDTDVPAALFKLRLRNIVRHWVRVKVLGQFPPNVRSRTKLPLPSKVYSGVAPHSDAKLIVEAKDFFSHGNFI